MVRLVAMFVVVSVVGVRVLVGIYRFCRQHVFEASYPTDLNTTSFFCPRKKGVAVSFLEPAK